MSVCNLCPRACGVDRGARSGFCGVSDTIRVARAAPHYWEEPPISGDKGSGAVFFSGCSLRCVFCQNYDISVGGFGKEVTPQELRAIFDRLIAEGCHNINLVTATHYADKVLEALIEPLSVPVVWNTGGYESLETLRKLSGKVQIYLPDMKYALPEPARKYSFAPDYFEVASKAISEMYDQVGDCEYDEDGLMRRGMIVRHLVLPGNLENSFRVMDWFSENYGDKGVCFSLMSQFTPMGRAKDFPELSRRLTEEEYALAVEYMEQLGIENGFYQELSSAKEEYTPDFDLTGV
ncbi:MAG: radical SAM protein [Oscillospiraceae bacterium]|nr:radical SAM protein [Oscillospiraceae bacterium]